MAVKKLVAAVVLSLACFGLTFVQPSFAADEKVKYKWKLGTLSPKDIGYGIHVRKILIPKLAEVTNGEVGVKIYWGGVMGDDVQHLKKMRIGQIQGAGLSGQGSFLACPEAAAIGLPFLFNDFDEVDYIKTKTFTAFDDFLQKRGLKMLLWLDQDFDQIYSVHVPLAQASNFKKTRFLTWFGPLEGALLEKLGTSPIPVGVTEIPSSMRQGIADAVIAPAIWIVATQLYSTARYVTPAKIRYTPAFFLLTPEIWDELPEKHQNSIAKNRHAMALEFNLEARKETQKCLKGMLDYGMKEVHVTPEDLAQIKEKTIAIWDELAGDLYPEELLEDIQMHLAQYRAQKK